MNLRQLLSVITCLTALGTASTASAKQFHVVDAGDTLWEISKNYGCEVKALREQNDLTDDSLKIGRKLRIPGGKTTNSTGKDARPVQVALATEPKPRANANAIQHRQSTGPTSKTPPPKAVTGLVRYTIAPGDTLGSIATLYDTSVDEIISRNGLKGTGIFAGKALRILPGEGGTGRRMVLGQSIGATNSGRLRNPSRLKASPGYFIRRPHRAYGASHTISEVRRAVSKARKQHPAHRLAVGDISAKKGGKISMHASHQSGRDIDLGFYFNKKPVGYPQAFVDVTAANVDFDATWTLLMSFVESAGRPGGAEKIFISYPTQKILYKKARQRRISKKRLAKVLQYPHGRDSRRALVRHEPGHTEHMHVRFGCPPKDERCK